MGFVWQSNGQINQYETQLVAVQIRRVTRCDFLSALIPIQTELDQAFSRTGNLSRVVFWARNSISWLTFKML